MITFAVLLTWLLTAFMSSVNTVKDFISSCWPLSSSTLASRICRSVALIPGYWASMEAMEASELTSCSISWSPGKLFAWGHWHAVNTFVYCIIWIWKPLHFKSSHLDHSTLEGRCTDQHWSLWRPDRVHSWGRMLKTAPTVQSAGTVTSPPTVLT